MCYLYESLSLRWAVGLEVHAAAATLSRDRHRVVQKAINRSSPSYRGLTPPLRARALKLIVFRSAC